MRPPPNSAVDTTHPVSNLTHLHQQQQRARKGTVDKTQSRGRDTSRNELGRRVGNGERITRIYPREM
jgi:hypothetical protein